MTEFYGLRFYSYGFFVGAAFIAVHAAMRWLGKIKGLDIGFLTRLYLIASVGAIICGKFFYWLNSGHIIRDYDFFSPYGNSTTGALIGGCFMSFLVIGIRRLRGFHINLPAVLDMGAILFCIACFVSRFGCLVAGCCAGREIDSEIFGRFHFPTVQLYILFDVMFIIFARISFEKGKSGLVSSWYLIFYGSSRLFLLSFHELQPSDASYINTLLLGMIVLGLTLFFYRQFGRSSANEIHQDNGKLGDTL